MLVEVWFDINENLQVKFEIDTNGVMDISAIDSDTGKLQKLELNILGLEQ